MSAISYAISKIKSMGIPMQVLNLAFLKKPNLFGISTSIDSQIRDLVIEPIVLKDLNVVGGKPLTIDVNTCYVDFYQNTFNTQNIVIKVPYEITGKKRIIEATELLLINNNKQFNMSTDPLTFGISKKFDFNMSTYNAGTPITNLELIGPNTILVYDNVVSLGQAYLNVIVEYNKNGSDIKRRYWLEFYKLCLLATKAFIYNKLIVDMNVGFIYNGHELGKVNETIESYADAAEQYEELLETKWRKITFLEDKNQMSAFVKGMIPGSAY